MVLLAAGVTALWLWTSGDDQQRAQRAVDALVAGDAASAESLTRDPGRTPAAERSLLVRAVALRNLGRYGEADRAFAAAAARDPNSWRLHREWAISLARAGDRQAARERFARARELNPQLPAPVELARP
jgi:Flp pilus assembly protein TadD